MRAGWEEPEGRVAYAVLCWGGEAGCDILKIHVGVRR